MAGVADWIAVDWGTSKFRAWIIGADGGVIAGLVSDKGMGMLAPDQCETALLDMVAPYLPEGRKTQVIACGAVGAQQGWVDAGYIKAPCTLFGEVRATRAPVTDPRLEVLVLPGLSQNDPADVMRGEETRIAGFIAENPGFDGSVCLPGTHSRWVQVVGGEVVSFRSFMTGDLFAAISEHTILQHSTGKATDDEAFLAGVADGLSHPNMLSSRLFQLRAEAILHGLSTDRVASRLSGLLIGLELAGARGYWLGTRVALVGSESLVAHYAEALKVQGVAPEIMDGNATVLAGLKAARAVIKGTPT